MLLDAGEKEPHKDVTGTLQNRLLVKGEELCVLVRSLLKAEHECLRLCLQVDVLKSQM